MIDKKQSPTGGAEVNKPELSEKAKEAKRAYMKKYREEHKAEINAYYSKYRKDNKSKIAEYNNRYWEKKAGNAM